MEKEKKSLLCSWWIKEVYFLIWLNAKTSQSFLQILFFRLLLLFESSYLTQFIENFKYYKYWQAIKVIWCCLTYPPKNVRQCTACIIIIELISGDTSKYFYWKIFSVPFRLYKHTGGNLNDTKENLRRPPIEFSPSRRTSHNISHRKCK